MKGKEGDRAEILVGLRVRKIYSVLKSIYRAKKRKLDGEVKGLDVLMMMYKKVVVQCSSCHGWELWRQCAGKKNNKKEIR